MKMEYLEEENRLLKAKTFELIRQVSKLQSEIFLLKNRQAMLPEETKSVQTEAPKLIEPAQKEFETMEAAESMMSSAESFEFSLLEATDTRSPSKAPESVDKTPATQFLTSTVNREPEEPEANYVIDAPSALVPQTLNNKTPVLALPQQMEEMTTQFAAPELSFRAGITSNATFGRQHAFGGENEQHTVPTQQAPSISAPTLPISEEEREEEETKHNPPLEQHLKTPTITFAFEAEEPVIQRPPSTTPAEDESLPDESSGMSAHSAQEGSASHEDEEERDFEFSAGECEESDENAAEVAEEQPEFYIEEEYPEEEEELEGFEEDVQEAEFFDNDQQVLPDEVVYGAVPDNMYEYAEYGVYEPYFEEEEENGGL